MTTLTIETKLGEKRSDKKEIKIVVSTYTVQFTHIYAAKTVQRKEKAYTPTL